MLKNTVSPQRGKRIDVQQRGKSHVGSQMKEKHVVDLIKMVKKTVGPQRVQKNKKGKELLHCIICTPLANKAMVHKEAKKRKKTKSLFLFFCCTNLFFF